VEGGARPGGVGRSAAIGLFVFLVLITAMLMVLSVPAGVYAVFSDRLSQTLHWTSPGHPYFWIGPAFGVVSFITISAGDWFLFLTGVYCLFMFISLRQKTGPLAAIRASFKQGIASLFSSPFLAFVIGTGFLSFTAFLIDNVVTSTGTGIGGPVGDPLSVFVGFTTAPLVEEFGFRVILIGLVALVLSLGRPWRDAFGALWRPSKALEGVAVGSAATFILWGATAFSAITFGACHVFCGTTWDIGKFPEAAFGGLVLGVLYVKYGFHVAVLVHWGIDYFGSAYAFFGQAAYGVDWTSSSNEFVGQLVVDVDMILVFGLASFLIVIYLLARRLAARKKVEAMGEFDKGLLGGGQAAT
jgi:hypothetical protein